MAGMFGGVDHLILFDLTQLILRSGFATPTGISRVELAYAKYLLEEHSDKTRFLIAFPPSTRVIPNHVARRYINATEMAWARSDQQVRRKTAHRLRRFLGIDPSELCTSTEVVTPPQRAPKNRLLLGASVMMSTVIESLRPKNLQALSRGARRITYISVSGSRLTSPWLTRWLLQNENVNGVFMLHDLIPVTHPEYSRPRASERHARHARQLLRCASVIVANSQSTADSLKEFAEHEALAMPMIAVAPLGVGELFRKPPRHVPSNPYFVFVGTIEPRKNHILLLQVWQRLVMKHGARAPKLVLIGKRGWENENIVDLLDRGGNLRRHVIELNQICDDVLAGVVANARALLLPSHVEGYGLPVAEALALGTPVICSDLPSLREIAGDVAEYVDPLAGRGWARTVMDYADLENPRRQAQLLRMQQFRAPQWSDHFARLDEAIMQLGRNAELPKRSVRQLVALGGAASQTLVH